MRIAVEERVAANVLEFQEIALAGLGFDPESARLLLIATISSGAALASAWYRGELPGTIDELSDRCVRLVVGMADGLLSPAQRQL